VLDRHDFNEDLISSIDRAMNFLKQYIPLRYEMTVEPRRKEIPDIPYEALREAIINAVAHRDYFEKGTNIANLLHQAGYIEKMGTGINKMKKLISKAGLPPIKFEFDTFFTATFKRPIEKWTKKLGEKLGENEVKIIELMKENKYVTTKELSEHIKISTTAIDKNISKLKKKRNIKENWPCQRRILGGNKKMTPCACATEDNQPFSHFLPPLRGDSSDTSSPLRGRI
jgi:ATP-dependent DNA helicase RecG